jgi:chromosomal replication initiator protein
MDQNTIWKNTLEELKVSVSPSVFQTFFSQSSLEKIEGNVATITFPNPYLTDLTEKRYYSLIKSALDRQTKKNTSLLFVTHKKSSSLKDTSSPSPLFDSPPVSQPPSYRPPSSTSSSSSLHPKYTFDTYIVGNSNNFAYAAAKAVLENPGLAYNPLFIWGGVGVGKTHLMQATGHALLNINPDSKLLYVSAETFGNDLVTSLQQKTVTKFKNKYRQLDVLLIDDIQFIAGKEYTQEEFFHTFNSLYMTGKQIILTSDKKPEEIQQLEDRLVSRFLGGLTVDIQPPDYETRLAILNQYISKQGIDIDPEALNLFATTVESNVREIEGRFRELTLQTQDQSQIDLNAVQQFFGLKSKTNSLKKINYRRALSLVSKHYQIKTSELLGKSRKKHLATARHVAAYLLRIDLGLSLQEVGRIIGGRDHTSIMHAVEKVKHLFSTNQQIRHEIVTIRKKY